MLPFETFLPLENESEHSKHHAPDQRKEADSFPCFADRAAFVLPPLAERNLVFRHSGIVAEHCTWVKYAIIVSIRTNLSVAAAPRVLSPTESASFYSVARG